MSTACQAGPLLVPQLLGEYPVSKGYEMAQKTQKPRKKPINPIVAIVVIVVVVALVIFIGSKWSKQIYEPKEYSEKERMPPAGFKGFGAAGGSGSRMGVGRMPAPGTKPANMPPGAGQQPPAAPKGGQ
jgi:hypothetical protein